MHSRDLTTRDKRFSSAFYFEKHVSHAIHFLFSVFQQTNLHIFKITLRYLIYVIHKVVERKIIETNLYVRKSSVYVAKILEQI